MVWEALELTASGRLKKNSLHQEGTETMKVVREFDTAERLTRVKSGVDPTNDGISHYQYSYVANGNVSQRIDSKNNVTENFSYDQLNRVLSSSGTSMVTRSFTYDKLGNITYRSDVGTYGYPASGSTSVRPHAVTSVTAPTTAGVGGITATYGYDGTGNLMTASGTVESPNEAVSVAFSRALAYMSFSLPSAICEARGAGAASQVLYSGGAATDCQNTGGASQYRYAYTYGPDHERVKLVAQRPDDTITTLYVHPGGAGELLFEKESRASNGYSETKRYLTAYGETFAVYVKKSTGTSEWRYLHRDALGSIGAITGNTGTVQESMSYEAFGERRYVTGARQDRTSPLLGVLTDRGFTGHEHLDEINLIHMNGRIFDPALARFMTADPFVQAAYYSQSYNRYSYVSNNPLRLIDPTGFAETPPLIQKKDGTETAKVEVSASRFELPAGVQVVTDPKLIGELLNALKGARGSGAGSRDRQSGILVTISPPKPTKGLSLQPFVTCDPGPCPAGAPTVSVYLFNACSDGACGGRQAVSVLTISEIGLQFVATHEGFSPTTYQDQAGYDTIGYGHKLTPGEAELYTGGIGREAAWSLLRADAQIAQSVVQGRVTVPLYQYEFDALVSFTYNVGGQNFANSTLLRQLNSGNYGAAADQFLRWNIVTINGQKVPSAGLSNRRAGERCMFLGGC